MLIFSIEGDVAHVAHSAADTHTSFGKRTLQYTQHVKNCTQQVLRVRKKPPKKQKEGSDEENSFLISCILIKCLLLGNQDANGKLKQDYTHNTFLNFSTTSLKHFQPATRNPTDAPTMRLSAQARILATNLEVTKQP